MKKITYKWSIASGVVIMLIAGIFMLATRRVNIVKQPINTETANSATSTKGDTAKQPINAQTTTPDALDKLFSIPDIHNVTGAFAVELGNGLLEAYNSTGPRLFIRCLSTYTQGKIDDITAIFAGTLFLVNKGDAIRRLREMKAQDSYTKNELYTINEILSDFNSFGTESPSNGLREVETMYKTAKILNVRQFGGHYALIDSQRPTYANMYDLYDLTTGECNILPTYPAFVSLQKIDSPNEFIFMSNGRNSESNYAGFPCMIKCTRDTSGHFTAVAETVYLPVTQSATFGAKGNEILSDVSVERNDIRAVFGPKAGNSTFYADFVIIPPTRTEYDAGKNELVFLFSKSSVSDKLLACPTMSTGDNAYVNSITLEQHGENCEIVFGLKSSTKAYTCRLRTTKTNGSGLPCVDIVFR